jgi:hypothetical protein
MKKMVLAVCFIMFLSLAGFAQSPLSGTDLSSAYQETDGYSVIEGFGRLHYWLYDTYKNRNGNSSDLLAALVLYAQKLGWIIDFDNIEVVSPNKTLAESVKTMMMSRNSDMSVVIIEFSAYTAAMYINNHDKQKNVWETITFPLMK